MKSLITGLVLTTTCVTGFYLLSNVGASTNASDPSTPAPAPVSGKKTAVPPCASHSRISPRVNAEQLQSELCHPWDSLDVMP